MALRRSRPSDRYFGNHGIGAYPLENPLCARGCWHPNPAHHVGGGGVKGLLKNNYDIEACWLERWTGLRKLWIGGHRSSRSYVES
jgi:hypothetical protein